MHVASWRALRAVPISYRRPASRIKAGFRRSPARNFRPSSVVSRGPEEPAGATASEKNDDSNKPEEAEGQSTPEIEAIDGAEKTKQSRDVSERAVQRHGYGSGIRRANRHRVTTGLPPLEFPDWFWENNVTCFGEPEDSTRRVEIERQLESVPPDKLKEMDTNAMLNNIINLSPKKVIAMTGSMRKLVIRKAVSGIYSANALSKEVASLISELEETRGKCQELESTTDGPFGMSWNEKGLERAILLRRHAVPMNRLKAIAEDQEFLLSNPGKWYSINEDVFAEIYSHLHGELMLPPPKVNIKDVIRQDTVLKYPVDGGLKFLDAVVQSVATTLEADIIRLDAEDISQIIGGYLGEDIAWTQSPISMLGYRRLNHSESIGTQDPMNNYEETNGSGEDEETEPSAFSPISIKASDVNPRITFLGALSKLSQVQNLPKIINLGSLPGRTTNSGTFAAQSANPDKNWNDFKLSRALDTIIDAADVKRSRSIVNTAKDQTLYKSLPLPSNKGLILQISGYDELNDHPLGYNLLKSLREAVKERWYGGRSIAIVGTTAGIIGKDYLKLPPIPLTRLSSKVSFHRPNTIYVPPERHPGRIPEDRKADIRDLNIRHVEHMIKKLLGPEHELQWTVDIHRGLWLNTKSELYSSVWSYDRVRRVATNMIGIARSDRLLDGSVFEQASHMLHLSDSRKLDWAKREFAAPTTVAEDTINAEQLDRKSPPLEEATKTSNLDTLKRQCTGNEKKIFGGVINPSDIRTTFADVRAPPETVEALKTLTSLSLIRPDSFSYGVLASDRIPGVLLYGPPGTGKTLLAKAVAKESGATMLEVSASEINDMYVGEGEKNVKALFSLAKKLAPCVVFIDEADSLLGSRGGLFERRSHREIINQFLREWDGMANLSAFIMVATNRPFDLDEAVLRRLPRRLLLDLPMEKDREAILEIHLKDEILDDSISLAALAQNTPFYSGSDLKNLCVAAALACVREENEMVAKHSGKEPYVYPPRRVLRKEHFDKAMEEISASISEDMSTLRAIRKFDESYGDRKGRHKKKLGMGFGGAADPGHDSEAARVRKSESNV